MAKEKKSPTVVDVLVRMRAILRKGWTQGTFAKSASGRKVDWENPRAASFCIYGARNRAVDQLGLRVYGAEAEECEALLEKCASRTDSRDLVHFNDAPERKKSEIIQVVTCAIEKAKAV